MGAAAVLTRDESMAHEYKPAPESKKPLSLRVPGSLKRKLEVLVRVWKAQAVARKDDPTNIDVTHVCTELLQDSVSAAFDLLGGYPTDEAGIEKLEQAIRDGAVVAQASSPKKK